MSILYKCPNYYICVFNFNFNNESLAIATQQYFCFVTIPEKFPTPCGIEKLKEKFSRYYRTVFEPKIKIRAQQTFYFLVFFLAVNMLFSKFYSVEMHQFACSKIL